MCSYTELQSGMISKLRIISTASNDIISNVEYQLVPLNTSQIRWKKSIFIRFLCWINNLKTQFKIQLYFLKHKTNINRSIVLHIFYFQTFELILILILSISFLSKIYESCLNIEFKEYHLHE